jgi:PIN domain nuclease of toxin-antitoxin system
VSDVPVGTGRRYLLDTHIWLWMLVDPRRLSSAVSRIASDPSSELLLSAASSWEIAIKYRLGKLPLSEPPATFIPDRLRRSGVQSLAIEHDHVVRVADLPDHHRDPFDRLLIAQAQALRVPVLTVDPAFTSYDVDLIG